MILNACTSAPVYTGARSAHFDGSSFSNSIPSDKNPWDIVKLFTGFYFLKESWPNWVDAEIEPERPVERSKQLRVTFINHSTLLVQVDNLNFLTDPIYADRASPFSWAGPKRVRSPGIAIEALPPIDAILISHNHYDHLDIDTLKAIYKRHPKDRKPIIIAGLGNGELFQQNTLNHFVDLDWNETQSVGSAKVTFTESRHRSGRGATDQMKTLWGSFVIETTQGPIYFAGDTGYGPHFKATGKRFGPFKLTLLPIGAYEPRWFMEAVHLDPEQAVLAHKDLLSEKSISIHFGTFQLTHEGINRPKLDLEIAKQKHGLKEEEFVALKFGEAILVN